MRSLKTRLEYLERRCAPATMDEAEAVGRFRQITTAYASGDAPPMTLAELGERAPGTRVAAFLGALGEGDTARGEPCTA